jgi:endonuclease/exonuclease/phosphatase family metal-dependent hydrolase
VASPDLTVDVLVAHLKSRRPDYRNGDTGDEPQLYALACLRSLVRRGTEAVALRVLASSLPKGIGRARVVLGDFNDVVDAVTSIVLGRRAGQRPPVRHTSCSGVDTCATSALCDGHYDIDHILVSEEFNATLPNAVGGVVDVVYLNDTWCSSWRRRPTTARCWRVRLFDAAAGLMDAGL